MARIKRDGTFYADDAKYTGNEPNWHNWEKLNNVEFGMKVKNALSFYAYYCTFEDLKKDFFIFVEQKFNKADVKLVKKHYKRCKQSLTTASKFTRMYNQGMPTKHHSLGSHEQYLDYVYKTFETVVEECRIYDLWDDNTVEEDTTKPVRKSPMQLLKEKISENVLAEIDVVVDSWSEHEKVDLKIMDLLGQNNVPANGCKFVREWLDIYLQDFELARTLSDDQAIEAYSYLSKRELNYICKSLRDAIEEVNKFEATKKKSRAPRKKKIKTAAAQVKDLKYCESFKNDEYEVKSTQVVRVPGSTEVVILNTKTNKLQVYFANGRSGFEVKGTSIKNFDEKKSYQFTIRKGKHSEVLKSQDWEKFAKNKKPVNGRVNEHCIILKVK